MDDFNFIARYTPVSAHWLADFPKPYRNREINLDRIHAFPVTQATKCLRDKIHIQRYRLETTDFLYLGHYQKVFVTDTPEKRDSFLDYLSSVRWLYQSYYNLEGYLPDRFDPFKRNMVSGPLLKKRLFFLDKARQIVSHPLSLKYIARHYNISKVNLAIWVAIYLNSGDDAFLVEDIQYEPCNRSDFQTRLYYAYDSVPLACADNLIFSRNRFRHLLTRLKRR